MSKFVLSILILSTASFACHRKNNAFPCKVAKDCGDGHICNQGVCAVALSKLDYETNDMVFWVGAPALIQPLVTTARASSFTISPTLSAGLKFNAKTGVISGTPEISTASAVYSVEAQQGDNTISAQLTIEVDGPKLEYSPGALTFVKGVPLSSGSPLGLNKQISCREHLGSPLPPGLSVDQEVPCQIIGTAQEVSEAKDYVIDVRYSAGTAQTKIRIDVNDGEVHTFPPSITTSLPIVKDYQFSTTGGRPPYEYKILSGPGLIDASGLYTTTAPGLTKVQVTDSLGRRDEIGISNLERRFDGIVRASATTSSATYVGGEFKAVNFYDAVNRVLAVDATTAQPKLSFDNQEGFEGSVATMITDGKSVYVGGSFKSYRGIPVGNFVKIDATTGKLDENFTRSGGFDDSITSLAISEGALFVSGRFREYRGKSVNGGLVKLNAFNGDLDTSFNSDAMGVAKSMVVAGSYLFVGGGLHLSSQNLNVSFAKISTKDGTLDLNFFQSPGLDGEVRSIAVSGESVFVAGYFKNYKNLPASNLAKLNINNGDLDTSFTQFFGLDAAANSLVVFGDHLYVGGDFTYYRGIPVGRIIKVDKIGGDLDINFTKTPGFDKEVRNLVVLGGSLFAGGSFNTYYNVSTRGLAKLDLENGSLDKDFSHSSDLPGGAFNLIGFDNTLFINGGGWSYGGVKAQGLAKFDSATGALDEGTTQVFDFNGKVLSLATLGDDVFAGGSFTTYRGVAAQRLAKINGNSATLDTSFTRPVGFDDEVYSLAVSEKGVYAGGVFKNYNGTVIGGIAKLHPMTGVLDRTFTKDVGFSSDVQTLVVYNDSVFAGGRFSTYRGIAAQGLVKINGVTGDLDNNFVKSPGLDGLIFGAFVVGKSIFVGGDFSTYRGASVSNLAKLDVSTGDLDPNFDRSGKFNGAVRSFVVANNALFVSGDYSYYRDIPAKGTIKLDPNTGTQDKNFTQPLDFFARVYRSLVLNGQLFVGGELRTHQSDSVTYFCGINMTSGYPEK